MITKQDLETRLRSIQLLVLDIDGTLTDGGMYYSAEGDVLKRFYVQDGMGITLLQRAGIEVAFLTSENSPIVTARAKKLGIKHVILGCRAKQQALMELAQKLNFTLEQIAYMGDDVNDEAPMSLVGVSSCPSDAVPLIQELVHYKCKKKGGNGAVREFIEQILKAQRKPHSLPHSW